MCLAPWLSLPEFVVKRLPNELPKPSRSETITTYGRIQWAEY